MKRIKMAIKEGRSSALLFYAYTLMPFIYLMSMPTLSRSLRVTLLLGIGLCLLVFESLRKQFVVNFSNIAPLAKVLLLYIILAVIISSLSPITFNNSTLLGTAPEFLGLITWLLFTILGIGFRYLTLTPFFSYWTMVILGIATLISFTGEIYYVDKGFRVAGVMFHPTSMAMFATISVQLAIHQYMQKTLTVRKKIGAMFIIIASVNTVIFTQSRVGYAVLATTLIVWIIYTFKKHNFLTVILLLLLSCLILLPKIYENHFIRMHSASVERGISYRADMYKTTAKDLLIHNPIIGNGANSLPKAINNLNSVPEPIARSLKDGNIFVSTHDMYFDIAYFFGTFAMIAVIGLTVIAVKNAFRMRNLTIALIMLILISNAIVNVPSIELTSLYFIILIALLPSSNQSLKSYFHSIKSKFLRA